MTSKYAGLQDACYLIHSKYDVQCWLRNDWTPAQKRRIRKRCRKLNLETLFD